MAVGVAFVMLVTQAVMATMPEADGVKVHAATSETLRRAAQGVLPQLRESPRARSGCKLPVLSRLSGASQLL
jgi:hypothetical protein